MVEKPPVDDNSEEASIVTLVHNRDWKVLRHVIYNIYHDTLSAFLGQKYDKELKSVVENSLHNITEVLFEMLGLKNDVKIVVELDDPDTGNMHIKLGEKETLYEQIDIWIDRLKAKYNSF